MAKSIIRTVVDQVLAENNLAHKSEYGIFVQTTDNGTRAKYCFHRVMSTRIMHNIMMATGSSGDLMDYKYRYVTLSRPQGYISSCDGLTVGCTNNEALIKRLCTEGPCIYTKGGLYYNNKHQVMTLGDFNSDELFCHPKNQPMKMELMTIAKLERRKAEHAESIKAQKAKAEENALKWQAEQMAKEEERTKAIRAEIAETQMGQLANQMLQAYKDAQVKHAAMVKALDVAQGQYSQDVIDQMESELFDLCWNWSQIGFPLVQK